MLRKNVFSSYDLLWNSSGVSSSWISEWSPNWSVIHQNEAFELVCIPQIIQMLVNVFLYRHPRRKDVDSCDMWLGRHRLSDATFRETISDNTGRYFSPRIGMPNISRLEQSPNTSYWIIVKEITFCELPTQTFQMLLFKILRKACLAHLVFTARIIPVPNVCCNDVEFCGRIFFIYFRQVSFFKPG